MIHQKAQFGIIGLAVMGANLVLNLVSKGFSVAVYNRTAQRTLDFAKKQNNSHIHPYYSIQDFVQALERPRKILLMVQSGTAVDEMIQQLEPYLDPGDILADGGNSFFEDTERRCTLLQGKNILYAGAGISGGEEGALHGPSMMPGGNPASWDCLRPFFEAASAKVAGLPCCAWIGPGGSGHFVKMLHNGIEYAFMQLIAEAYGLMRDLLKMSPDEISRVFGSWNQKELRSFLVETASEVLVCKDPESGDYLINRILDKPGQKGTGKWTLIQALESGSPVPVIAEAVFARMTAADKPRRMILHDILPGPDPEAAHASLSSGKKDFLEDLEKALYASVLCVYAQGFQMLRNASVQHQWELNLSEIARIWRGGCIIRADILTDLQNLFSQNPGLDNFLESRYFTQVLGKAQDSWRRVVCRGISAGISLSAFSSALAAYDAIRTQNLPANMIQALRDSFGAHMFERTDRPEGLFFHGPWHNSEAQISSTVYNA